eukprot:gnl/TRDRNA2_/TRDRNA2_192822_c0_seq1.p1 gnl/TRDRNA2_/TRDRNA2_192822_c0~~gnl/TRDRNA2_/TRDRNA2_192822_c0_seq1.p1  ORF type:complete len:352 (-),score=27.14 gnl/TRDRNA2_/TRDRNA2_192822_c0_seq1:54-1109(-)
MATGDLRTCMRLKRHSADESRQCRGTVRTLCCGILGVGCVAALCRAVPNSLSPPSAVRSSPTLQAVNLFVLGRSRPKPALHPGVRPGGSLQARARPDDHAAHQYREAGAQYGQQGDEESTRQYADIAPDRDWEYYGRLRSEHQPRQVDMPNMQAADWGRQSGQYDQHGTHQVPSSAPQVGASQVGASGVAGNWADWRAAMMGSQYAAQTGANQAETSHTGENFAGPRGGDPQPASSEFVPRYTDYGQPRPARSHHAESWRNEEDVVPFEEWFQNGLRKETNLRWKAASAIRPLVKKVKENFDDWWAAQVAAAEQSAQQTYGSSYAETYRAYERAYEKYMETRQQYDHHEQR